MEPIPLRILALLSNYERTTSNPKYKGLRLFDTSFAGPEIIAKLRKSEGKKLANQPPSVIHEDFHYFVGPFDTTKPPSTSPATVQIEESAPPRVQTLSRMDRNLAYLELQSAGGCWSSTELLGHFFRICPRNQMLSVQLTNEKPVPIDPTSHEVLGFHVYGPKQLTISHFQQLLESGVVKSTFYGTGLKKENPEDKYVVDMSRMQSGAAGICYHMDQKYRGPNFVGDYPI